MQLGKLKQGLSAVEQLERELNLKQLQINRLLTITQAINNNVKKSGLFEMYRSFLSWEMDVKKMALFVRNEKQWECATSIGIEEDVLMIDISDELGQYTRLNNLRDNDHPFFKLFDVVIPVRHKEESLAYVFIGGFSADEDKYNKIQFITAITNVITVAIENKMLFKNQLHQERLNREMELAKEMQQLLIPKHMPSTDKYALASIYKPHLNVGGDYFDFLEHSNGSITFCIADIAGKGVAAALMMSNFQASFHTLLERTKNLKEFVQELNKAVMRITKGDRFLTFFVANYCIKTRKLTYINAGHMPPVLAMEGKVQRLTKGCTVLGAFEELPEVEEGCITIAEEALILLFTDGLSELRNETGDFLDHNFENDFILANYRLSATEFIDKMLKELELFSGKAGFGDDFTVLSCKIF
jgi:sigma-B regulation protein RsbU (phosphoserine phosphatase)